MGAVPLAVDLPDHRQQTMRGLSPGTRLGRYTVVRRIGSGGMAELYLGRLDGPEGFLKPVALKLMHPHLSDDRHFAQMFLKEARIAAALEHPAIAQVIDVGEFGGEYFMALEFVHGRDLRKLLSELRGTPIPLGAALRVVLEVGRALHYAHRLRDPGGRALGIVHRDVSPSNVLLSFQGAVKLADFGVAKMAERSNATASGSLKGKLGYMSPEQCMQEHVDARSDVFSLGVVLYEATTGRRAFRAEQPVAVMNRVIDGQWVAPARFVPDYPPALHEILAKALEVDVERRYPSAEAMCEALEAFAAKAGLDTRPEALATFLQERYGQPAAPDLDVPTLEMPRLRPLDLDPDASTFDDGPRRRGRPRRLLTAAAAVGVLAVGGLLGWQAGRSGGAELEATPGRGSMPSPGPTLGRGDATVIAPRVGGPALAEPVAVGRSPDASAQQADEGAQQADEGAQQADAGAQQADAGAKQADAGAPEPRAEPEPPSQAAEASSTPTKRRRRRKASDKSETERAREILFPKSSR